MVGMVDLLQDFGGRLFTTRPTAKLTILKRVTKSDVPGFTVNFEVYDDSHILSVAFDAVSGCFTFNLHGSTPIDVEWIQFVHLPGFQKGGPK
ncbi:hypothetical protein [uncultured Marinobacter sp.]|uniref:hypothetical protein n=1 Tax=uncultured Marinobacter sp. TaxID=187379 RepID=UPI002595C564|nr:hypothetical protein [uncultured Marinobacter sp.]